MAATNPIANVPGSSQVSGSQVPQHVAPMVPRTWSVTHAPAANNVATITQAAPGANLKNVVTGLCVTFAAGAIAPAAVQVTAHLRDGATGAGTPKKSWVLALPATAGAMAGLVRNKLWIEMTSNTVTTLEFTAAGGSSTIEAVEMDGGVIDG